ncbi:hypothetical protein A0H81_08595 [Grifola frondosa]|uniref:Uncharacterized protein n=1 Tax=Grifola frondosa TaxID=5627 RepID=A0A1C7M8I0_GRIFR|nr:hypothetical protein A0H81_08595 [Grifola frondosa]
MKNIFCYIVKDGYAARVTGTRSYDAVSEDILSRWMFPLVPDNNRLGGHLHEHLHGYRYITKYNSVILSGMSPSLPSLHPAHPPTEHARSGRTCSSAGAHRS